MKNISILLLYISSHCLSQERKMFFGKTLDDLGELPSVHVINKNTSQATSSNNNGEFKVFAQPNDTIQFTFVGYKTQTLVLQSSDFSIHEKQIRLKKEVIELDEIELKKHNLTGSLSLDIKNVKNKKQVNAKTLQLPNANVKKLTQAERRLYTAQGGSKPLRLGLASAVSLDYIINSFSGRLKKLKSLKKIEDNEKQINHLKNTFTNYIFNDLQIDSTNISRFIYFCQESKDYKAIKQKGEFAIIKFLKEKALEFKNLNQKQ